MRIDEIRRLIKLVEESQINELEIRRWMTRVRIVKRSEELSDDARGTTVRLPALPQAPAAATRESSSAVPAGPAAPVQAAETGEEAGLVAIRSPMVGTFYRAPSPQSPPYVDVNQRVAVGQVVCIVEAMKLMNEIESEVAGTIAKILVQNGMPVEFNQTLFLVRPD